MPTTLPPASDCLLRVTSLRACGFVAILYTVESLKLNTKRKRNSIEQLHPKTRLVN